MIACKIFLKTIGLLTLKQRCHGKVKGGVGYFSRLEETKEISNQIYYVTLQQIWFKKRTIKWAIKNI